MSRDLGDCVYCENRAVWGCDGCQSQVCNRCSVVTARDAEGVPDEVLCNPDVNTWPGQGCYRPPVAECVACEKPTAEVHADVPLHPGCRP